MNMVNFFKKLFNFSKNEKDENSVVGIDVGSFSIKVVQLKRIGGKVSLETYGSLPMVSQTHYSNGQIRSVSTEAKIRALNSLFGKAGITANHSGMAIPFVSSMVSIMEMPKLAEKQLAEMVPIEARKYIPVPIKEVTLDWSVIVDDEEEGVEGSSDSEADNFKKVDVLVAAIPNDVISNFEKIVERVSMNNHFFEIEMFSALRSVLSDELQPVLVLDMGATTTKLYIVEGGAIRNSHSISRGSNDLTLSMSRALNVSLEEAEKIKIENGLAGGNDNNEVMEAISVSLSHIFSETEKTITNYNKKYEKTVSKIILIGGGSTLKGFSEIAQNNLNTPVEKGDPFSKVHSPMFLKSLLKEIGPEYAVALGVATRAMEEIG